MPAHYRIIRTANMPPDGEGDTNLLGLCDRPAKRIYVLRSLQNRLELEVLIHELLHTRIFLSERTVDNLGHLLANRLWSLGYRRSQRRGRGKRQKGRG